MALALVFDLDGTLIDSAPDLHRALARLLSEEGLPVPTLAEITDMVGDGAAMLVGRAFAHAGRPADDALPDLLARFLAFYEAEPAVVTRPYAGVAETLAALQAAGHSMAVCTNKPDAPSRAVLGALGLAPYFDVVVGGDTAPAKKPDPRHLETVLARLDAVAANTVMIGDGINDLLVAGAAGVPAIHASYGYGLRGAPDVAPAATIDRFDALPDAIARIGLQVSG